MRVKMAFGCYLFSEKCIKPLWLISNDAVPREIKNASRPMTKLLIIATEAVMPGVRLEDRKIFSLVDKNTKSNLFELIFNRTFGRLSGLSDI